MLQTDRWVWDRVCRHLDGVAIGSTIAALDAHGVLDFLMEREAVTAGTIVRRFGANPGYLHVALRLLACQGWMLQDGPAGSDELTCALTPAGRGVVPLAAAYRRASVLFEALHPPGEPITGPPTPAMRDALRAFASEIEREWSVPGRGLPVLTEWQVIGHLDGHAVAPIASRLATRAITQTACERGAFDLDETGFADEAGAILAAQGWVRVRGSVAELTPAGRIAFACAKQYWYPMAYATTLARVPELLFGRLPADTDTAEETHVDRELDLRFSGSVFSVRCRDALLAAVLPIFDREPLDAQPSAVVDTGCGDGALLEAIYAGVRERTARGRELERRPLTMCGVEPSASGRRMARERFEAHGVPAVVVDGAIEEPAAIAARLSALGVDAFDALHTSKSVIHNRRYVVPSDDEHADGVPRSTCPFTLPDGSSIEGGRLERNLVGHFARWMPLARRHGLVVIEAHTAPAPTIARLLGRSISTVVDALHGYSNQYLVEPEVFAAAARAAGYVSRAHDELGARTTGHPVLTVDYFVAADPAAV